MKNLPRILIIDDQYGIVHDEANRPRQSFCFLAGLQDVTGDMPAESINNPSAEVVFCSGQKEVNENVINDLEGTLAFIRAGWVSGPRWAMVLLDLQFNTGTRNDAYNQICPPEDRDPSRYFGLILLEHIKADPELRGIPVVLLSSMNREAVEQRFSEQGALEFIDKEEINRRHGRQRMGELLLSHGLIEDEEIIGNSLPLLKCLKEARQRAQLGNDNILILGESGTGKELLAHYIHRHSPNIEGPYVTVFTQGAPENLIEDRLFGHEKGAFTGSDSSATGAVEDASKGTLFIDEFGDIPASIQPKLLRLLDRNIRETQRIGAKQAGIVDLQTVLATNRVDILQAEDFRKDLLHRIGVGSPLILPALRDRKEDIPILAEYFLRKYERAFHEKLGAEWREISAEALDVLQDYDWPGNIRELERVIENAVYRFPKLKVLSAAHFNLSIPAKLNNNIPLEGPAPCLPQSYNLPKLLRECDFDPARPASWTSKLPELQASYAVCIANLLRAALRATRKPTLDHPEGEIKIHPAMKLLSGNKKLTASQAADMIKRLLSLDRQNIDTFLSDPLLGEAYHTAVRLRPTSAKKRKRAGQSPPKGETAQHKGY